MADQEQTSANNSRFSRDEAEQANNVTQSARRLTEELKDQLGIQTRLNEGQRETLNLARALQRSAQENNVIIGNSGNIERQINKDLKTRSAIQRELRDLAKIRTSQQAKNADLISEYTEKLRDLQEERNQASKEELADIDRRINKTEKLLFSSELLKDKTAQRIALLKQSQDLVSDLIESRQEEAVIQTKINDKMGVTGALVKGTGALMERLGMRTGIFNDAMSESAEIMREMSEESVRDIGKNYSRLEIMAAGLTKLTKGFSKALLDPFTITTLIVNKFFELNKASTKLVNLTGQNASFQSAVNTELASGAQIMELMSEYAEETGLNTNAIFSADDLARMTEATNILGLTNKQSLRLGELSKISGKNFETVQEEIVAGTNAMNSQMNAAVAHGAVMRDIADVSHGISLSLGNNPIQISKAVTAAKSLGFTLQDIDDIASSLLDFEQSIGNELEAQLLTGKDLHLNKARVYALNNDMVGLVKELKNNGLSVAEYAGMNRIQQEAVAKSLGMQRNELGKMIATQAMQGEITKEQKARMQNMTVEQMEQMEAAESLQMAFSKMAEPLAAILNQLTPTLTIVSKIVAAIAPFGAPIFIAYKGIQLFNSGLMRSIGNITKLITKSTVLEGLFNKGIFGKIGNKGKGLLSKIFGDKGGAENVTKKVGDQAGGGIKSITGAIGKIDMTKVLKGAAAMALVAGSLYIFGKAVQEFTEVSWGDVGKAVVSMFALTGAVMALGAIMTSGVGAVAIIAGAGAMLIMASAVFVLGKATQELGKGFNMFLPGLITLGENSDKLFKVGGGLMSIATGLGAIAGAGLLALPAIAALSTLSSLGGIGTPETLNTGEQNASTSENQQIVQLLKELKEEVKKGGNVYLDGGKVGEALIMGSYISE